MRALRFPRSCQGTEYSLFVEAARNIGVICCMVVTARMRDRLVRKAGRSCFQRFQMCSMSLLLGSLAGFTGSKVTGRDLS